MMDFTAFSLDIIQNTGDAHSANKTAYFKRGLPFYTCMDAAANIYKKEFPDGSSEKVFREWKDGVYVEKSFEELEMA